MYAIRSYYAGVFVVPETANGVIIQCMICCCAVLDQDFEVPLPGVKIRISETGQEVESSDAGSYFLEGIEPGSYTLLFSKSGYTRITRPGVVVSPGQLAEVDAESYNFV